MIILNYNFEKDIRQFESYMSLQQHQLSQKNLHKPQAHPQQQQNSQPSYYCTSWGLASKGQLGYAYHSIKSINASQVTPLDKNENFLDVGCGENHTLLLTDALEIVSCGSNTYG